jgi:hypothetical protein
MALSLGTQDYSTGMLDGGIYHFLISKSAVGNSGKLEVECQILAGTTGGQVGKRQTEFFGLDGKALNRLYSLAIACGIVPVGDTAPLTPQRLQQLQAAGQPCNIDEAHFVGRSFIGEVVLEEYKGNDPEKAGRKYPNIGFRIHSVYKSKEFNCPLDEFNAKLMAKLLPPPQGGTGGTTPPAGSGAPVAPPPAPAAPAAAANSFFS